jgi:hypothetical protein
MDMRSFVTEQSVTRYRRWLEDGVEEATRNTLLKLWLVEEDMLGLTREQLTRIATNGGDPQRSQLLLATLKISWRPIRVIVKGSSPLSREGKVR